MDAPREGDIVELLEPVGGWRAGTNAIVLATYPDKRAMVEVMPAKGTVNAFLEVRYDDLRLIQRAPPEE